MNIFFAMIRHAQRPLRLTLAAGLSCCLPLLPHASLADGYKQAEHQVKNLPCTAAETVDQILTRTHRNLNPDRGWRVVAMDDGDYLVERIFMASKSAELLYRWRVGAGDAPAAISDRAKMLCDNG